MVIENFLKEYIQTTLRRYSGKTIAWDVVNEAIDGQTAEIRDSVWTKVDDFLCKAFQWAHEADPDTILFYNDFGHSTTSGYWSKKADAVFNLIKDLKERNCPIHGVGFQLHQDVDFAPHVAGVASNVKRYNDIGIKVHFTEIDIKCRRDSDKNCVEWTDELLQKQADTYKALLQVCLEAENCENFETWGYTDKYSWLPEPQNGLPFDKEYKKKVSYDTLLKTLNEFPRDHAAVIAKNKRIQEKKNPDQGYFLY